MKGWRLFCAAVFVGAFAIGLWEHAVMIDKLNERVLKLEKR